ncbi:hypothetical protein CORC01_08635 [Colletotrichum orchidophilum]|uniref:Uncharacterized protein n=1 Tax=Colletotrichum orchidophilum TaxID=1209926 RepID=A0A1G4B3V1_9PEZI|nr:uncharacterized protein CORC01_08635 [Colletotrichum orchidophilum]OHE96098.1 hypothetical protein CORC01_08635 [Colletotrichum orchidophilum]
MIDQCVCTDSVRQPAVFLTPSFILLRFTPFYTCLPDDFTTPPCDLVIASIGVWRFTLPCCLHHNLLFNVHMTPPVFGTGISAELSYATEPGLHLWVDLARSPQPHGMKL